MERSAFQKSPVCGKLPPLYIKKLLNFYFLLLYLFLEKKLKCYTKNQSFLSFIFIILIKNCRQTLLYWVVTCCKIFYKMNEKQGKQETVEVWLVRGTD